MKNRKNPKRVANNPLPHIVLDPDAHRKLCLASKATGMSRKRLVSEMIWRFLGRLLAQLGFKDTQKGQ